MEGKLWAVAACRADQTLVEWLGNVRDHVLGTCRVVRKIELRNMRITQGQSPGGEHAPFAHIVSTRRRVSLSRSPFIFSLSRLCLP